MMHFNSTKNTYEYNEAQEFKRFRVDNETEYEVLVDVVLNRGTIVVTVKKVFD